MLAGLSAIETPFRIRPAAFVSVLDFFSALALVFVSPPSSKISGFAAFSSIIFLC